jgi:site-specific recombinase XerD
MNTQNETTAPSENVIEVNFNEFAAPNGSAQSVVTKLSKQLARECRRHRLSYDQLKRIFVNTRRMCEIEVPKQKNKLLELPSDADLRKWFDAVKDPTHKLIMNTLLGTGLRVAELCGIELKNVDFANNTVLIKNAKGGKQRVVIVGNKLKCLLEVHVAGKKQRYLFESNLRKTKLSTRWVQAIAERASKVSGIHVHVHMLRHIFATRLAANSISERARGVLMGHSPSSVSQLQERYTHVTIPHIKEKTIEVVDSFDL